VVIAEWSLLYDKLQLTDSSDPPPKSLTGFAESPRSTGRISDFFFFDL
jgi:hypothetical protein